MFTEFMEQYGSIAYTLIIIAAVLLFVWALLQFIVVKGKVKGIPEIRPLVKEGFGGVAVGAGQPDCLRTLSDAAAVYGRFVGNVSDTKDLDELRLIFSKWACLKKDLLSPSGIVEATRYTPYSTLHDRIPTADIAGQCNAKTMPARDLDITFETWRDRAVYLLRRLCTEASLGPGEVDALEKQMLSAWADVYDVAKSQCLTYIPSGSKLLPRDAAPMTPDEVADLGPYKGYY
jgi:hypothetical protein